MIKMKRYFLILASTLLIASCGSNTNPVPSNPTSEPSNPISASIDPTSEPSNPAGESSKPAGETSHNPGSSSASSAPAEKTNFEKALEAVSSFDIEKTNGYDYSLRQYYGRDEVNSDVIVLRADFSDDIKAQKVETIRRLNQYGTGEQFTTTETTTYYNNNMICELKNNQWKWSNFKKSEFFAVSIANMKFDKAYLSSVKESTKDNKYVISADVPDEKIKEFLGSTETSFTGLSLKLTFSSNVSSFESVELSYLQSNTRSELKFSTYVGNVSIVLPN